MPETWTPPKTWSQKIVTVADLNTHLRDNLLYLKNLSLYTDAATGLSSTATSDTDMRTLWFASRYGSPILLIATARVRTNSGSYTGTFNVKLDGVTQHQMIHASANGVPLTWARIVTGLSVGTHSLKYSAYVTSPGVLYLDHVALTTLELP